MENQDSLNKVMTEIKEVIDKYNLNLDYIVSIRTNDDEIQLCTSNINIQNSYSYSHMLSEISDAWKKINIKQSPKLLKD